MLGTGNETVAGYAAAMQSWLFLFGAIAAEVIGTTALKATHGFTRLLPSLVVVVAYALAFYLLSRTMQTIPMSISYAVWSGVGIVLITLIGYVVYHQTLDLAALIGLGLILAGVLVIHLFSKSVAH
ncbi:Multidrug transporter EmrE and related cation transporters [Thiomonas bhubaneswarensis]|uniref:Multidrug transporter EmrE and related cation transporters n=2 Tax=Thiomonas bhubaneswarensis TaxID=339866 RepID=A0A0K6HT53_9BURK|nr:Multidrug transporter EmrE and related cation transporters [Thiomonas bhubaneswarensis]